jgi:hypothetical protein
MHTTGIFSIAGAVVVVATSVALIVVFTTGSDDEEAVRLKCPSIDDEPDPLNIRGGQPIELNNFNNDLCTLWRIGPGSKRTPVARSYEGNPWEVYAGEFSEKIQFQCQKGNCKTILPSLEDDDQFYELASFQHSAPQNDQIARFLEQATFGPTRSTIMEFPDSYSEWVHEQMALPDSSHRRFYRSRLNHRKTVSSQQGVATHPCQAGTRYRKYAFSDKDRQATLEIRTDPVSSRKILLKDGQARTVLPFSFIYAGGSLIQDGL